MNITFTPAAAKFMRRMVRFSGVGGEAGLRLLVSPGGCSGVTSEFSVEAGAQPGDAALELDDLKVFLPAQSRLLLEGATVDFTDTPVSSGLTFVLAQGGSCGCSTSTAAVPGVAKVDVASIVRRA